MKKLFLLLFLLNSSLCDSHCLNGFCYIHLMPACINTWTKTHQALPFYTSHMRMDNTSSWMTSSGNSIHREMRNIYNFFWKRPLNPWWARGGGEEWGIWGFWSLLSLGGDWVGFWLKLNFSASSLDAVIYPRRHWFTIFFQSLCDYVLSFLLS